MPQELLHHLELGSDTSEQSRVSVPERVPSELFLNSEAQRHRTNVFAQDRLSPVRPSSPASPAGKDPIICRCVAGTFPPFQQSVREERMNGHRLLRCFGLARAYYTVNDGTRDAHISLRKVDVFPLQSEHLTLPQARGYREEDQGSFPNA